MTMRYLFVLLGILGSFSAFAQQNDKTLSPFFWVNRAASNQETLPLKSTSADVNIVGVIADVIITQTYVNTGNKPIEAFYIFPGSTNAAVYGMKMQVGQKTITAKIAKRQEARATYEAAKRKGKRASLLEQERPNVFQMNVANIMPGDTVRTLLQYTELLVPNEGTYEFVYPTVVGPRYGSQKSSNKPNNTSYQRQNQAPLYDFNLQLRLAAGMPIQSVDCVTHQIQTDYKGTNEAIVRLTDSETQGGNRDFVLQYSLRGNQIESGLMLFDDGKEKFFLCMAQPPKRIEKSQLPPREYIFVLDVSGSMNGFPLDVAKELLRNLISGLNGRDRFNVILFAGTSNILADESIKSNAENIQKALEFIDKQEGSGGTELLPALQRALQLPRRHKGLSRSVLLFTDGYIDADAQCIDLVRNNLNKCNLFAFGIGSSVNRYLMEGVAHAGAGQAFFVLNEKQAKPVANKFKKYVTNPVMTEIKARFVDFDAYDVEPLSIPDVMSDRPVLLFGKWRGEPKGQIRLVGYSGKQSGKTGSSEDRKIELGFDVATVSPDSRNAALKYLWARERIRSIDDYSSFGARPKDKDTVTKLGLKYSLLTAYTSFVAVEEETANEHPDQLKKVEQPLPLPQGVSDLAVGFDLGFEGVSGLPASKPSVGFFLIGLLLLFLSGIIFKKMGFRTKLWVVLLGTIGMGSCSNKNTEYTTAQSITFILGEDHYDENPYFSLASLYFTTNSLEKTDITTDTCTTLQEISDYLTARRPKHHPWKRINLVVHGNQWTGLRTRINQEFPYRTTAEILRKAVRERTFSPPPTQMVDTSTLIVVYGCNLGKDTLLLSALSEAFGRASVCSAPYMNIFESNGETCSRYLADYYYAVFPAGTFPGNQPLVKELKCKYPNVALDWTTALCNKKPEKWGIPYVYHFTIPAKWTTCYPQGLPNVDIGNTSAKFAWVHQQPELIHQIESMSLRPEQFNWELRYTKVAISGHDSIPGIEALGTAKIYGVLQPLERSDRHSFADSLSDAYYVSIRF
jgi:hypothetical protein